MPDWTSDFLKTRKVGKSATHRQAVDREEEEVKCTQSTLK